MKFALLRVSEETGSSTAKEYFANLLNVILEIFGLCVYNEIIEVSGDELIE